jgi:hypothetical protein
MCLVMDEYRTGLSKPRHIKVDKYFTRKQLLVLCLNKISWNQIANWFLKFLDLKQNGCVKQDFKPSKLASLSYSYVTGSS